ncbi:hypothetical protein AVEN_169753-1, partial [Araneus ventricosus]
MASRQSEMQIFAAAAFTVMTEILKKKKTKTLVDYKSAPKTKCQHIIQDLRFQESS